MAKFKPEWKEEMLGIEHSFADIAKTAKVATDTVIAVMSGSDAKDSTKKSIRAALDKLRGTCSHCGQDLPRKEEWNAAVRRKRIERATAEA